MTLIESAKATVESSPVSIIEYHDMHIMPDIWGISGEVSQVE
jgi:hypothetical protein